MFGFSELEEKLNGPDGVAVARDTLAALHAIRDDVEAQRTAGLSTGDYDAANAILMAVSAAEVILANPLRQNGD